MKFKVSRREKNRLKRENKQKLLKQSNRTYAIGRRRVKKEEYFDRKADRRKHREEMEAIMEQVNKNIEE